MTEELEKLKRDTLKMFGALGVEEIPVGEGAYRKTGDDVNYVYDECTDHHRRNWTKTYRPLRDYEWKDVHGLLVTRCGEKISRDAVIEDLGLEAE